MSGGSRPGGCAAGYAIVHLGSVDGVADTSQEGNAEGYSDEGDAGEETGCDGDIGPERHAHGQVP
jgi:hypothetical protein